MASLKAVLLISLAAMAASRNVPANVKTFYDSIRSKSSCSNKLATGFHSKHGDSGTVSYCGNHISDYNVLYLQGSGGKLVNMDVDCDGIQGSPADDGRCGSSSATQSITSFAHVFRGYGANKKGFNGTDLDANAHPYVVFGNAGSKSRWKTFSPRDYGIQPLSVMAVVCNDKLIYGIWGDTNGDDGHYPMVGEASISLATACFGEGINGNSGHDEDDVLYIAFPGADAVPGAEGARWNAQSYDDFADSIRDFGDELIQRIGNGGDDA